MPTSIRVRVLSQAVRKILGVELNVEQIIQVS
jgi:hypothetical protein